MISVGIVVISVDIVADVTMTLIPGQQRYYRVIVYATVLCIVLCIVRLNNENILFLLHLLICFPLCLFLSMTLTIFLSVRPMLLLCGNEYQTYSTQWRN